MSLLNDNAVAPRALAGLYEPVGHTRWDPLFGDESLLTLSNAVQAKGNLVRSRARYLQERFGQKVFDAVAARLTGEAHEFLVSPPLAHTWCSYKSLRELDCMICEEAMGGNILHMKPFGFAVASYDIPTVYKALYHLASPRQLMQLIGMAWGLYLKPGKLKVEGVSDNASRVTLVGSVVGRYLCEVGICGWMEATVGFSGARRPLCVHTRCRHRRDPVCEWEVTWA